MALPTVDLTGRKFGEWTVIERAPNRRGKASWRCRCSCGREKDVYATHLLRGVSSQCRNLHGRLPKNTPGYTSWRAMISRCELKSHPHYEKYGGRGIQVCAEWRGSFSRFYADMGPRPAGTTLERKDNDGNYEPANCCWAEPIVQQNNRRTNRFVEVDGQSMTVAQYARRLDLSYQTVYARVRRGRL